MLLEPSYAENIIVGVINKKNWEWFITDKDLWFLDYNKLDKAYKERGFDIIDLIDMGERKDIKVIDQKSKYKFLENISDYSISKGELKKILKKAIQSDEYEDLLDFSPSLLIDFDKQNLYSMFPEPASFEEYVPEGWDGEYRDITDLVPNEEKYWIEDNGDNLFLKK